METQAYTAKNKIRIVTAAALFDGHDAAINIMRRIMQRSGAEIIHLGHNRSAQEIVETAIQEDVQGIAITSYQGGHNEFFKYMFDLLKERGAGHIKIFGGGGGTILPTEIDELHAYGICRIYSPDDGRAMGLQGMINDLLGKCDYPTGQNISSELEKFKSKDKYAIANSSQPLRMSQKHRMPGLLNWRKWPQLRKHPFWELQELVEQENHRL